MTSSVLRDASRISHRAGKSGDPAARAYTIDLVHLSRQTLGDRSLEVELLGLFERQCAQILEKLERAGGGESRFRRDLAHTLKGSARAVGAGAVADAAELYETELGLCQDDAKLLASLATLRAACEEARGEVARLLLAEV
jgi:HPt (histidine-containing phosphotransfer) domain-containing protein